MSRLWAIAWVTRKSCVVVSCSFIRCCWVQSPLQSDPRQNIPHTHATLAFTQTFIVHRFYFLQKLFVSEGVPLVKMKHEIIYYNFSKFLYQLCSWFMILTIEVTIDYARPYISSQRCKLPHLCKFQCCAACNSENCIIGNFGFFTTTLLQGYTGEF